VEGIACGSIMLHSSAPVVELSSAMTNVSGLRALIGSNGHCGHAPAGARTTDRAQLIKDLQTCVTSHDVIQRVGRHVNTRVDPTEVLARLVLVRLSKQCISVDKERSNEPSLWKNEAMKRVLSPVFCCLVESDLDSDDVCETLVEVEGPKCASVLSRLIPECNESLKEPLHDCWSRMSGRLVPCLNVQSLSGPSLFYHSWLSQRPDFNVDDIRTNFNSNRIVKERRQTDSRQHGKARQRSPCGSRNGQSTCRSKNLCGRI
jgi:hypothetical protein